MQEYSVKVTLPDGQVMAVTASESDTLEAVADRFKDYYEDDIILGIVNGRLRELNKKIKSDCELSFVTTADRDGRRTYRRSVVLLLQRAIYACIFTSISFIAFFLVRIFSRTISFPSLLTFMKGQILSTFPTNPAVFEIRPPLIKNVRSDEKNQ